MLSTSTTTTSTTSTTAPAATILGALAGDSAASRRLLLSALRRSPDVAAARACACAAHRQTTAAARRRATEAALGAAPASVLELIESAHDRWIRRCRLALGSDPLARRRPGTAPGRAVLTELSRLYREANFRSARHSHETNLDLGTPSARSESGSVWSAEVGMSSAYCRSAYRVATSEHSLSADSRIFAAEVSARVGRGWLLLAPDLRVRQGRGTSLVVEHRTGRGAWRAA
jgi:hypothetical protein